MASTPERYGPHENRRPSRRVAAAYFQIEITNAGVIEDLFAAYAIAAEMEQDMPWTRAKELRELIENVARHLHVTS